MLPFSYAARNLLRDPIVLMQTVGGYALVVFLVLFAGSFNAGMNGVLGGTGSPQNVILLGAGSEESIERSEIPPKTATIAVAGIANVVARLGQPAASPEVHYMGVVELPRRPREQAILRGITPAAFEVHREVQLIEGRFPASGEILVGRLAHSVLGLPRDALSIGSELVFEGQTFKVSGKFAAPGTVMESEIWMNLRDLMTAVRRETVSCVILRMETPESFKNADLFSRQRLDLELVALRESDYYGRLAGFYAPLRGIAWLTAAIVAVGAVFGGLNMLYAAFASRIREFATLQAIGYGRGAILFSLIQESFLAALLGTLIGTSSAVFFLQGISVPFSIGTFSLLFEPGVLSTGLCTGLVLGLVGALPPAYRCLNTPLSSAFRAG